MSDTPETNSIIRNAQASDHPPTRLAAMLTVKCEKLERERDEAREEIKEWKTLCLWGGTPEHIHGFIRGQQSRIQHLECERDEAMELLASEKITRNHIIKRSVEVEQERDEAREALEFRRELYKVQEKCLEDARCERDEAREVLKRIAHASMSARHKEEDYAEWEKAVESLQGICEEKNFINE